MATSTLTPQDNDQQKRNPGQQHEEQLTDFSERLGRHGVLDEGIASKEGAIDQARARLRNSEDQAVSDDRGDRGSRTPISQREDQPGNWRTFMNRQELNRRSQLNTRERRRRGIFIGLGAGGGVLSLVAGFSFMLPFKIPGPMDLITDKAGERLERTVTKVGERILLNYFLCGSEAAVKKGKNCGIVTGNVIGDLFATWRTHQFEERLKSRWGLEIVEGPGDTIRLIHNGGSLDNARNVAELYEILQKNDLTFRDIKVIVNTEIPTWRYFKRLKYANWLRLKYGKPRFGIKNSDKEKPADQVAEMEETRLKESYSRLSRTFLAGLKCMLAKSDCPPELGGDNKDLLGDKKDKVAIEEIERGLSESVEESSKQGAKAASQGLSNQANEIVQETLLKKFATKAIPIVGWVDLAATIDHIVYNSLENDYYAKVPAYFKQVSYAQAYSDWVGFGDQIKAGDMNPFYVGWLAQRFNRIEESLAHNYIDGRPDTGEDLPAGEKINYLNPSLPTQIWSTTKWIPGSPGNVYAHQILNAYYETLGEGGLLGWIGGTLGGFLSQLVQWFPLSNMFLGWIDNFMKDHLKDMLSFLGWVADPTALGAKLYNGLFAGGASTMDLYCKEIGCRKLTDDQANEQAIGMAQEREDRLARAPVNERLFSLDNPYSLASTFAAQLPTNGSSSITYGSFASTMQMIGKLPSNIASIFTKPAKAVNAPYDFSYRNLFGSDGPYGTLDGDLPVEAPNELNCSETPHDGNGVDVCKLYRNVGEIMKCNVVVCADPVNDPVANVGGGVGGKVDYSNLYRKIPAGTVPDNMLCSMGPEYSSGKKLLCGPATESFMAMNQAYKGAFGKPMPVGQGYRTAAEQIRRNQEGAGSFAKYNPNSTPPGHLWGTSIDFNTGTFRIGTPEHTWTVQNGPKFGWFWPNWAREGRGGTAGVVEPWHFDYFFVGHNPDRDDLEYLD